MKLKVWATLSVCILLLLSSGTTVFAKDFSTELTLMLDDPQAERENGKILDGFYDESVEESDYGISLLSLPYGYTHNSKFDGCTVRNGIDVSSYQGDIDWNAVKAEGIEFAIIRVGYRGYGERGNLREDTRYVRNIQGALNAGLKVGVYIFSQATTTAEAIEEADFVLSRIRGYNISFPVVMDFEYASLSSGEGGRLHDANLSRREATEVCKAFVARVANAGYTPMIYANKSMLRNHVYASELSALSRIWLANYTYTTDYEGDYVCWQYTSSGFINGISGRVDMNFWYEKPTTIYQGVDYSAVYDFDYYINNYSDIKDAYANDPSGALWHFVNAGMSEGRQGNAEFNVTAYKNRYVDLRNVYGTNLEQYYLHYIHGGKNEGRIASGSSALVGSVTTYNGKDYSDVFNFEFYMDKYADLKAIYANDDVAALYHFVNAGMTEGRQGNEEFDVNTYRTRYEDLRRAFGNNWKQYYLHYMNGGKDEGRSGAGTATLTGTTVYNGIDYSAVYDFDYYINKYSDLKSYFANDDIGALEHFVNAGMSEGRRGNEEFDVNTYRTRYADLRSVYGNDLKSYYVHYVQIGKAEGRSGSGTAQFVGTTIYNGIDYSAVYNYDYYCSRYEALKNSCNGDENAMLQHFVEYGMSEGRRGNADFSVIAYRSRYDDLQNAFGNDLKSYYMHYVQGGKAEGRNGAPYNAADYAAVYDFDTYMRMNPGLQAVYGTDPEGALEHFVEYGMSEGRQASEEFNVYAYRSLYADLNAAYGEDLEKYFAHYMHAGKAEGRQATWELVTASVPEQEIQPVSTDKQESGAELPDSETKAVELEPEQDVVEEPVIQ